MVQLQPSVLSTSCCEIGIVCIDACCQLHHTGAVVQHSMHVAMADDHHANHFMPYHSAVVHPQLAGMLTDKSTEQARAAGEHMHKQWS